MNILITGANGMVGQNFYRILNKEKKFNIYLTSKNKNNLNNGINYIQCDFNIKNSFKNLKNFVNPDLIIHCAAMTNVDLCEINQKEAYKINVDSSKLLLEMFSDKKIIFISTDAVFGSKNINTENSHPNPDNYYGLTKYYSERIIMQNKDNVIIRTTPIGFNYFENSGFLNWILSSIYQKKQINIFDDVYFNPIHTSLLLKYILLIAKENMNGTYHINSNFNHSKYEFVRKLLFNLKLNSSFVNKVKFNNSNFKAVRNKNQILLFNSSEKKLNIKYPKIKDSFNAISNDLKNILILNRLSTND